jgi:hypothetical protein
MNSCRLLLELAMTQLSETLVRPETKLQNYKMRKYTQQHFAWKKGKIKSTLFNIHTASRKPCPLLLSYVL